jgi:hypothetical protein
MTCFAVTFTFIFNTHPSRAKSGSFLRASLQLWILKDEQPEQKKKGIVPSMQATVD